MPNLFEYSMLRRGGVRLQRVKGCASRETHAWRVVRTLMSRPVSLAVTCSGNGERWRKNHNVPKLQPELQNQAGLPDRGDAGHPLTCSRSSKHASSGIAHAMRLGRRNSYPVPSSMEMNWAGKEYYRERFSQATL
jgi:hypothetical protein